MVAAAPSPERLVGRVADYREHDGASSSLEPDDLVRLITIGVDAQSGAKWSTQSGLLVELALVRMAKLKRTVDLEEIVRAVGGSSAPADSGGGAGGRRARGRAESSEASDGRGGAAPSGGSGNGGARSRPRNPGTAPRASGSGDPPVAPELWPRILEKIRCERPGLAASLTGAVATPATGGELGLLVPNGSRFHREQLLDRGNMTLMEGAATAVFGQPVRLRFEFGAAPGEGVQGISATSAASERGQPESDPMVQKVLEVFDGEIKSVRRKE